MRSAHRQVAQKMARWLMLSDVQLNAEWIAGKHNAITDSLSRDFHLSNAKLTDMLRRHVPQQMSQTFRIYKLPKKITSWLLALLQSLPKPTATCPQLQASTVSAGTAGSPALTRRASVGTPSSTLSRTTSTQSSSEVSSPACDLASFKREGTKE